MKDEQEWIEDCPKKHDVDKKSFEGLFSDVKPWEVYRETQRIIDKVVDGDLFLIRFSLRFVAAITVILNITERYISLRYRGGFMNVEDYIDLEVALLLVGVLLVLALFFVGDSLNILKMKMRRISDKNSSRVNSPRGIAFGAIRKRIRSGEWLLLVTRGLLLLLLIQTFVNLYKTAT